MLDGIKRNLPKIVAFLLVAVFVVVASIWRSRMDSAELSWMPTKQDGSTHLGVFIGIAIGLAITLVLVCANSKGWFGYRERVKHALTNPFFVVSLIVALFLYFFVFVVANAINPAPVAEPKRFWPSLAYHIEVNPGGWFAVLTGIATLCGLAVALEQLWDTFI